MYYLQETRITPLITVRRERMLPARGEVLVRPGEQVGPADVVARCQVPGGTEVIDVSRALGVPPRRAARLIRKSVGDTVQANEILASYGGLAGRLKPTCRSPVGGKVIAVRESLVLIEASPISFELRAHLKGQIVSAMPGLGVVISTTGALIQAVWGIGGEADGVLKLLTDSARKPIRARSIDVSCHATVIAGGSGLDEKALDQAVEAKVRGLIVGSVSADLRSVLKELPFPVIITEGFGAHPMSQSIFALLQANAGREVMMNATTEMRWGTRRPEVLIPLRPDEALPAGEETSLELRPGIQVRGLREPHIGVVGTVTDRPVQYVVVESGTRLPVAEVTTQGGDSVLIPIANLELIR